MKTQPSLKDYEQLEFLGEGTYGVVYKAIHLKHNGIVAIKNIKL
jgi:serine/threonine protein kinase